MTLPHQLGLDREAGSRPDSRIAADAHAREWDAIMHPIPKMSRTRKALYIALPVLAVLAGLVWFWSKMPEPYTVDTSTPRGAVGAYFEALQDEDLQTAADLLCQGEGLDAADFLESTAREIREHPMKPWPVVIRDAEPLYDDVFVVEYSVSRYTDPLVVVPDDGGEYHVCGFAPSP